MCVRMPKQVAVVVKGWPRLSETFIAQELVALERMGLRLSLHSLRHPTDARAHAMLMPTYSQSVCQNPQPPH